MLCAFMEFQVLNFQAQHLLASKAKSIVSLRPQKSDARIASNLELLANLASPRA